MKKLLSATLKQIPNFFTSLNLLSGCIALVMVFHGHLHIAAIMVLIATLFDFLDGFFARLLKAYSPMGKELDSLADLVTFGVVPATIIFSYFEAQKTGTTDILGISYWSIFAFIIAIFSALRLAKFNVDTRQTDSFIGLPTPANAIFIVSIPLILHYGNESSFIYSILSWLVGSTAALFVLSFSLSVLLVAELPLMSLKIKSFSFSQNKGRFVFLTLSLLSIVFFQLYALPLIIILYILISIATNIISKNNYWYRRLGRCQF